MSALGHKRTICSAKGHVRFAPNSDRESGFPQTVMSALPPKADMCGANRNVRFGPEADIPTCANNAPLWVKSGNQASNIDVRLPIGCSLWLTALTKDHSKQHLFSCGSPE
jgi:hypothetical protein